MVPGTYEAALTVTNDLGYSDTCTWTVDVTVVQPEAVCSASATSVAVGIETFDLIGSGSSDPQGRPLTATWTFTALPLGATVAMPPGGLDRGPIVPDRLGTYEATLVVENDLGVSSDPCTVTVTADADPPVAWCSAYPQTVEAGVDTFLLIGENSFDPAGRGLVGGAWSWTQRPAGSTLQIPPGIELNRGPFVADRVGTYVAELEVTNDLGLDSSPCTATVVATEPDPVAVCEALPDRVQANVDGFTLVGNASYDPLGTPITQATWTFTQRPSGSGTTIPGGTAVDRGPIVPDTGGIYEARLVVTNANGRTSDPCFVTITATEPDRPVAVCEAVPPQLVAIHEDFDLRGNQSYDPQGLPLTASWQFLQVPAGSAVTMPGTTALNRNNITPDTVGNYVAELTVTNSAGVSSFPCTTSARATVNADLWVELSWSVREDIDLHLIRANGSRNSGQDCHWDNCRNGRPWGAAGTADDPYLDIDDRFGRGPENINIATPERLRYTVTVHDFPGNGDFRGNNDVRVRIFVLGTPMYDQTFVMSGENTWRDVAEVDLRGTVPVVTPL